MQTSQAPISRTEDGGFTLVEVLVVLVVVSVCFGMVVFSVTGSGPQDELQAEAERLAGWIRVATGWAAEHGSGCTLRYDLAAGAFEAQVEGEDEEAPYEIIRHRVRAPVRIERLVVVRETVVTVVEGAVELNVFSGGICEPHLVTLRRAGAESRSLEVNPITGDVTVLAGRRDYALTDIDRLFGEGTGF